MTAADDYLKSYEKMFRNLITFLRPWTALMNNYKGNTKKKRLKRVNKLIQIKKNSGFTNHKFSHFVHFKTGHFLRSRQYYL
jgi:hypothetical protein